MAQSGNAVEPWLRNTHLELDAVRRQVVHALELTAEDNARWCGSLAAEELNARPYGLPSVAFQMLHIARSLDRLLCYAEGFALNDMQRAQLASEHEPAERDELFAEFRTGIEESIDRVRGFTPGLYEETRFVGRDRLPTTAGALLIHCAEHTQRHAGQMVTTAKLVLARRTETSDRTMHI